MTAKVTHSEYIILSSLRGYNGYAKEHFLLNFLFTLPVFFDIRIVENIEVQYMEKELFFRIKPGSVQDKYPQNFEELNYLLR